MRINRVVSKKFVLAIATASVAAAALPSMASASEPALLTPKATLDAAIHCYGPSLTTSKLTPIMLVTGTGATGQQAYLIGQGAFELYGHPVCVVDFPYSTTADVQVSVEYLVNGIRYMNTQAKKKIAIFGISQGGLLPRWALTYWPSLRSKVSDVLAAAGTQHGTNTINIAACRVAPGCIPAGWQQAAGSNLLKALNKYPDETPGTTSWTTVRSSNDETVQPQTGAHPTSSLKGATNILIQDVCKNRKVGHIQTAVDSVTFAAAKDAIEHSGAAKVSRLPKTVCSGPFAPGLDPFNTWVILTAAKQLTSGNQTSNPGVTAEPAVRAYAKK